MSFLDGLGAPREGSASIPIAQRIGLAFVLVGSLVAGVVYDVVDQPTPLQAGAAAVDTVVNPAVLSPARLDGAWYCPVGSSVPDGYADHTVNIANFADEPAVATVSVITGDGPGPRDRIELAPLSTQRIALSNIQAAEAAGAVVEIIGGDGAVSHTVTTEHGAAEGPCATHASNTWYFSSGRTTFDAEEYLVLMNPFPETAVFDLTFRALDRPKEPGALDGAVVQAQSVRVIRVNDYVVREESLAATVKTQRGRLVVERLQVMTGDQSPSGEVGPVGAALQLGVSAAARSWMFTGGRVQEGGDDRLVIYNPFELDGPPVAGSTSLLSSSLDEDADDDSSEDADSTDADSADGDEGLNSTAGIDAGGEDGTEQLDLSGSLSPTDEGSTTVSVQLWPLNPTDLSNYGVVTIRREVWPGLFTEIDLRAEAERFEFPLPYELGVNVTSDDGLPIVVERWQFGTKLVDAFAALEEATVAADESDEETEADPLVGDAGLDLQPAEVVTDLPQPIATDGLATSRGNEQFSERWLIPWVRVDGDSTLVAIAALEETAAEVRVLNVSGFSDPTTVSIAAGGRAIVPIRAVGGGAAVEIRSESAIAVEAVVVLGDEIDVVPAIPTFTR